MPKMTFIDPDGNRKEVDAPEGLSVLEIAHRNGIDLEGACEGSLACSTCHVVVDDAWFDKLEESTEPGTVTIATTPSGLTVFMNDYLVPQPTPVLFDVRAGIYELVIEDNDEVVLRKTVFVQPGQTLSLELNIKKVRRIDYDDPWK